MFKKQNFLGINLGNEKYSRFSFSPFTWSPNEAPYPYDVCVFQCFGSSCAASRSDGIAEKHDSFSSLLIWIR